MKKSKKDDFIKNLEFVTSKKYLNHFYIVCMLINIFISALIFTAIVVFMGVENVTEF